MSQEERDWLEWLKRARDSARLETVSSVSDGGTNGLDVVFIAPRLNQVPATPKVAAISFLLGNHVTLRRCSVHHITRRRTYRKLQALAAVCSSSAGRDDDLR
jgi:hypothetical protein